MDYLMLSNKTRAKVMEYLPDDKEFNKMALYFQNFCDGTRLKIISCLAVSDMCVNDLSKLLDINQTTISHQLKYLKAQDIVCYERIGKIMVYHLNDKKVNDIMYLAVCNIWLKKIVSFDIILVGEIMKGKLIVIEGTDCSGKETQSNLLVKKLNEMGIKTEKFCFPNYQSATGKILAGPYLGKPDYCEGYFEEGASNVDPKVASLYFAADRKYNINKIQQRLDEGVNVVVDRYIDSNLAHQGSKIFDDKKRKKMFAFLEKLEYGLLELPRADVTIFLYMPTEVAKILKAHREEKPDQHESDENYLKNSEKVYLQLAKMHGYVKIDCADNDKPKSIQEISNIVLEKILKKVSK